MQNYPRNALFGALFLSVGLVGHATAATATGADTGSPDQAKKVTTLNAVTVTGSNIPTTPDQAVVPVTSIDSDAIKASGVNTNVLDLLRKVVPSFAGRGNAGNSNANNTNQNTAGGSQIQLRNLDTLVLVNGRRVATSGINGIGGKSFVDANEIPVAAIDHIEVLTDGASAIYGSDAIGGVVNIILKSDYQGVQVGARYGSAKGHYGERSAYVVAGTSGHGISVTATASTSKSDPLRQNARSFSSPFTGRLSNVPGAVGANGLFPGALLAPGVDSPSLRNPTGTQATATSVNDLINNGTYVATTPAGVASGYDLSRFQTLLLRQKQDAFTVNATADLIDDNRLSAFGDAIYSHTRSFTQFLPISSTVTVPAGAPYNPLAGPFKQVIFAYQPRPKQYFNDSVAKRVTGGLRGDIGGGWSWEVSGVHSEDKLEQRQRNVIYAPNLSRAIAGGYDAQGNPVAGGSYSRVASGFSGAGPFVIQPALDPFALAGGITPATLGNLYGTEVIDAKSTLNSLDAKLVGKLFELPAGAIGFAAGAGTRREALSAHTDPNGTNTGPTNHNWIGGIGADPFSRSRTIDSAYAEFRVPITSASWTLPGAHAFDLVGAVRAERYSDAGHSLVPKIGFRWEPFDSQFTVRGSFSRSFTAPTLYAMFGPTDTRQIGSGVIQSVFGLPGLQFNGEDGNNPNLKPSKAVTRSLGVTFNPAALKGLTVTLDYSSVDQRGYPGGIGFTNILQSVDQLGAASPFSGNLALGNFPGLPGATAFTAPGQVGNYLRSGGDPNNLYAIDRFTNLGGLHVRSANLTAQYYFTTANLGTFTLATNGAMFFKYQFQALPGQAFYNYAGFATNGGTGVQGTIPKYSFYSTLDWQYGNWDVNLGNTYMSAVTDIGPGGLVYATSKTLKPLGVSSYTTWDLRVGYARDLEASGLVKGWSVGVGINNLFDRMPPLAPQAFTDNNADVSTYSPIGRLVYAMASIKF